MNIFAICEQWNGTSLYTTFPPGRHWSNIINSAAAGVQHGLILIPAWISNNISGKVCDEITYPFTNFNDCTVEVWEWISNFNTRFIMDVIFLSMSWYQGDAMSHGIVLIYSCLEKLSLYDCTMLVDGIVIMQQLIRLSDAHVRQLYWLIDHIH